MGISAHDLFGGKKEENSKEAGHKQGLFGSAKSVISHSVNYSDVSSQVNNVSRRLRILEERYVNLRKKAQLTEQNMMANNKKVQTSMREVSSEVTNLKSEINKINEKITVMNGELNECANRYDVQAIDKYVDFWEPMNFLTVEEAKKMIGEFKEKFLQKRDG